jgi:hypothetical protein
MQRFFIPGLLVSVLVGCGGGGGGSATTPTTNTDTTSTNALAKYVGSYASECTLASTHRKDFTTITQNSDGTLSIAVQEVYYDGAKCTGSVVGTATVAPLIAAYQSTSIEVVTGISGSIFLDKISVAMPSSTTNFGGTNVVGSCVTYQNGRTCYENLTRTATTTNGGLHLEGTKLYTLSIGGVGYKVDAVTNRV